jgi:hypothetical protein
VGNSEINWLTVFAQCKVAWRLQFDVPVAINDPVDFRTGNADEPSSKECEWKDGDRGGLAEWEKTHRKHEAKPRLDINRSSHGRT